MSTGVIYVAIGDRYIEETLQSVASLKTAMPNVNTTIFCDRKLESTYFDNIVVVNAEERIMIHESDAKRCYYIKLCFELRI